MLGNVHKMPSGILFILWQMPINFYYVVGQLIDLLYQKNNCLLKLHWLYQEAKKKERKTAL